jgi:hypothetical protein
MLYIDQPIQTGYSYNTPVNGKLDLLTGQFAPLTSQSDSVLTNLTTVAATMSPQDVNGTVSTTGLAARTMWQFAQVWFQDFPEYAATGKEINMWTYSVSRSKRKCVLPPLPLLIILLIWPKNSTPASSVQPRSPTSKSRTKRSGRARLKTRKPSLSPLALLA